MVKIRINKTKLQLIAEWESSWFDFDIYAQKSRDNPFIHKLFPH